MRILVIEDDITLLNGLVAALEKDGCLVEHSRFGETGWFLGSTENFDAMILDLSLPDMDGLEVLKKLRAENNSLPILILTARGGWSERVQGIKLGADDYIAKPFHMEEVIARLHALIRRSHGHGREVLTSHGVTIDLSDRTSEVNGTLVDLGSLEWRALSYLMLNTGTLIQFDDLAEYVYGADADHKLNALEALIMRLRKKLGVALIQTRRGAGYVIPDQSKASS